MESAGSGEVKQDTKVNLTNIKHLVNYCKNLPAEFTDEPDDAYPLRSFVAGAEAEIGQLGQFEQQAIKAEPQAVPSGESEDMKCFKRVFWEMLQAIEMRAKPGRDILEVNTVTDAYRILNKVTGSELKPRWEN